MDAVEFEIQTEERTAGERSIAMVRVKGEVDLANANELGDALLSDTCRQADGVLLEMSELGFMDSSGLRAVLVAVEELDVPLVAVAELGSAVARLLELAEIDERVGRFPDETSALAALAKA